MTGLLAKLQSKSVEAEFQKLAITDEQDKPVIVMLEDPNTKVRRDSNDDTPTALRRCKSTRTTPAAS